MHEFARAASPGRRPFFFRIRLLQPQRLTTVLNWTELPK
jgi:hypothetical protein